MEEAFGACPFVTAQRVLSGKWALLILHELSLRTMRFGELQRTLPSITQATLTKQLREMEDCGLIDRKVYPQVPPKVEYSLSGVGRAFLPVLAELETWGNRYIETMNREKPGWLAAKAAGQL